MAKKTRMRKKDKDLLFIVFLLEKISSFFLIGVSILELYQNCLDFFILILGLFLLLNLKFFFVLKLPKLYGICGSQYKLSRFI